MHTIRTRFKNEIVAEVLPPARAVKKQRVVIVCSGAPSSPSKKSLLEFLGKKGFWAIHFRYRGSWESDGVFLKNSPHLDILDIIDELPTGFTDTWTQKKYKVNPDQIIILSSSFGGSAAILALPDSRIDKVIAISPMLDWTKPGPDEPYPKMIKFFKEGFGNGYRIAKNGWTKLQSGKFFNPVNHTCDIEGAKLLLIHAKDDKTCPYPITKEFSNQTGAKLITLPRGDHLSSNIIQSPRFFKAFRTFIKQ
jgi:cephalosporin-C deacetylase-like acetyl esterase